MKKIILIVFLTVLQFSYGQIKNDTIKSETLDDVIIVARNPISERNLYESCL